MIGIPFFPGFASKLSITLASLETPYAILVPAVIAVSTVLSGMYYLPAMACFISKRGQPDSPETRNRPSSSWLYRTAIAGFMAFTILLGFFPQQILRLIEQGLAVYK